jgi:hypothetical protein
VNVLFWSQDYANKQSGSIVKMEKEQLWNRHIGKGEYKSLFILNIDGSQLPPEFEDNVVIHNLNDIGIVSAEKLIFERLVKCFPSSINYSDDVSHPTKTIGRRCRMTPIKFRLSSNYKQDGLGRWDRLGDILVVPLNSNITKDFKTYLIPSKLSPTFLSHPTSIQTDSKLLNIKKRCGEAFFKENFGSDINGVIFDIEDSGARYPHIYNYDYDIYVSTNWRKYI